jgi:hypothetical protein
MSDNCKCANSYYKNKPKLKLESETTHNANFKSYPIEPTPSLQPPKIIQKKYDPELLQSSYKTTYTKPNIKAESSANDTAIINQYYQNKPKNIPFSTETEYNKSYQKTNVSFTLFRGNQSLSQPTFTSQRQLSSKVSQVINLNLFQRTIQISRIKPNKAT